MSEQRSGAPAPQPPPATPKVAKVTVYNNSPHPVIVDFGVAEDGQRKVLSIPTGKVDKMKQSTPGKREHVPKAVWDSLKDHLTARFLVSKGVLTAIEE